MVKGPLAIVGSLILGGGITGLVHATPKILQSAEVICQQVTETFKESSKVSGDKKIEWLDGTFSELPWDGGLEKGNENSANCYRR